MVREGGHWQVEERRKQQQNEEGRENVMVKKQEVYVCLRLREISPLLPHLADQSFPETEIGGEAKMETYPAL